MSGQNKDVPIPRKDFGSEFRTLESFEESLSSRAKGPFKVLPDNPTKREIFRKTFESVEAVAYRNKVVVPHLTELWKTVAEFKELVVIASQKKESGRDILDGIFAVTENAIRNAREELGGRIAQMISQRRFNDLERILDAIQKPHKNPEKPLEIYLMIFEYIEEKAHFPPSYEVLRVFYNDKKRRSQSGPDTAQDATNFRKIVIKLGFLLHIPTKRL